MPAFSAELVGTIAVHGANICVTALMALEATHDLCIPAACQSVLQQEHCHKDHESSMCV